MIEQTFEIGSSPRLIAEIGSGSLEISQGPGHTIAVHIEGGRDRAVEVAQSGDTVSIRRPREQGWASRGASTRVRAEVPAGTSVSVTTASGKVASSAQLGEVSIDSASGDIALGEVEAAKIKTASGDVAIRAVNGEATLRTASGDVRIGNAFSRLEVTTASGSVDVATAGESVASSASSGDLTIARFEGSDLDLRSVSGNIRVGIPQGTRVALDARSLSGVIRLPERAPQAGGGSGRSVRAGIRTVSGDIEIRRVD